MGRQSTWNENKIAEWQKDGYGQGEGSNYKPWLNVQDFSSLGRSRRAWSHKTGRVHQLFSDVEFRIFLALEWSLDVIDIKEQYPLDRALSQDVARSMRVKHPCYPSTTIPTVMTVDFLVTVANHEGNSLIAINAKRKEEGEDERSLVKLEIQRRYFELFPIPHHLVYHSQIPVQKISNIEWIRNAVQKEGEIESQASGFIELKRCMTNELRHAPLGQHLNAYCAAFDGRHGIERGTGLRTAKLLMLDRTLIANLDCRDLANAPLSEFSVIQTGVKKRDEGAT